MLSVVHGDKAALDAPEPSEYPVHLERMQLTKPEGLKEDVYQRLLLAGLKASENQRFDVTIV